MKNLNKKGFFLIETIVVVAIVATVLVVLYSQINSFFSNYARNSKYNTVNAIHAAHNIKTYIVQNYTSNLVTDLGTSGPLFDITTYTFDATGYYSDLINKFNISKVYFTPYDINNVITNYATYNVNASMLDFLRTQKVNDSKADTYRIIVVLNSGEYASIYFIDETPLLIVATDASVTNITSTSTSVTGSVTNATGVTERGIAYGTNVDPTVTGSKVTASGTEGSFTASLINLSPNTLYHARAYATTGSGTTYGDDITFTTAFGGIDSYAKLMLHMDGIDNGTTFTDEIGKTVTRYGDTVTKTGVKKFGTASGYFDGTGDYLSVPDSDDWNFGAGNFTIDFWVNFSTASLTQMYYLFSQVGDASNYILIRKNDDPNLKWRFQVVSGGTSVLALQVGDDSTNPQVGQWYHIAVVRNGNVFTIYKDGVALGNTTLSITLPDLSGPVEFGRASYSSTSNLFNGYIDEVRVSKGIARWTSNFTPPTLPYTQ